MPRKTVVRVAHNDVEGTQFEVDNILITIRRNGHHGIAGSIAFKENGKTKLVPFHGKGPDALFPLEVHPEEQV